MNDAQILNWIVQGGSFGLIVAIIVFLGKVMFPRAVKLLEDQADKFDRMLTATEARNERELARRDATCDKLATSVGEMAAQIRELSAVVHGMKEKTDEHRPLPPRQ